MQSLSLPPLLMKFTASLTFPQPLKGAWRPPLDPGPGKVTTNAGETRGVAVYPE
jgi:hypothetical protein